MIAAAVAFGIAGPASAQPVLTPVHEIELVLEDWYVDTVDLPAGDFVLVYTHQYPDSSGMFDVHHATDSTIEWPVPPKAIRTSAIVEFSVETPGPYNVMVVNGTARLFRLGRER